MSESLAPVQETPKTKKRAKKFQPVSYSPEDRYKMSEFLRTHRTSSYTSQEFSELENSLSMKKGRKPLSAALTYMKRQLAQKHYQPEELGITKPALLSSVVPSATIRVPFKEYEVDLANKQLILHL